MSYCLFVLVHHVGDYPNTQTSVFPHNSINCLNFLFSSWGYWSTETFIIFNFVPTFSLSSFQKNSVGILLISQEVWRWWLCYRLLKVQDDCALASMNFGTAGWNCLKGQQLKTSRTQSPIQSWKNVFRKFPANEVNFTCGKIKAFMREPHWTSGQH